MPKGLLPESGYKWLDNKTIAKPKPKPKVEGAKPKPVKLLAGPPNSPADLKAYHEAHIHRAGPPRRPH